MISCQRLRAPLSACASPPFLVRGVCRCWFMVGSSLKGLVESGFLLCLGYRLLSTLRPPVNTADHNSPPEAQACPRALLAQAARPVLSLAPSLALSEATGCSPNTPVLLSILLSWCCQLRRPPPALTCSRQAPILPVRCGVAASPPAAAPTAGRRQPGSSGTAQTPPLHSPEPVVAVCKDRGAVRHAATQGLSVLQE